MYKTSTCLAGSIGNGFGTAFDEIQDALDTLWYGGELWIGEEEFWALVESELQD